MTQRFLPETEAIELIKVQKISWVLFYGPTA